VRDETFRISKNRKEPSDSRYIVLPLHRAWPGLQRGNSKGFRFSNPLCHIDFPDVLHDWLRHDTHPLDMEHDRCLPLVHENESGEHFKAVIVECFTFGFDDEYSRNGLREGIKGSCLDNFLISSGLDFDNRGNFFGGAS
jgi:hypothetical protein